MESHHLVIFLFYLNIDQQHPLEWANQKTWTLFSDLRVHNERSEKSHLLDREKSEADKTPICRENAWDHWWTDIFKQAISYEVSVQVSFLSLYEAIYSCSLKHIY